VSVDALELMKQRSRLTHEQILKVVDGLTEEQLAWRPTPRAHSMGWTVWHLARSADAFAAQATESEQIWARERLAAAWELPEALVGSNGLGTGVDDVTAATLRPPSRDALLDYTRRSFAALDEVVTALDERGIARERATLFFDEPAPLGRALIASIGHDNRHLGELEYLKGLLGLRGSATR
jgi:hypothetical protein